MIFDDYSKTRKNKMKFFGEKSRGIVQKIRLMIERDVLEQLYHPLTLFRDVE